MTSSTSISDAIEHDRGDLLAQIETAGESALSELLLWTRHPSVFKRYGAVHGLSLIASRSPTACEALLGVLHDADEGVRRLALSVLESEIALDATSFERVRALLRATRTASECHVTLAWLLARWGTREQLLSLLDALHVSSAVSFAWVSALAHLGDPEALQAVLASLESTQGPARVEWMRLQGPFLLGRHYTPVLHVLLSDPRTAQQQHGACLRVCDLAVNMIATQCSLSFSTREPCFYTQAQLLEARQALSSRSL